MIRTPRSPISALILILVLVLLGSALVMSLGGPGQSGVWHSLYDISRNAAGTLSVDPNNNGEINFIENNVVTTIKIKDGEVGYDDVNPNEVCATNPQGGSNAACKIVLDQQSCQTVYAANGSGKVPIPNKCYDQDADGSGSCEILFTLIQDLPGNQHYYGVIQYTQFDVPNSIGGAAAAIWVARNGVVQVAGAPTDPAYLANTYGINGNQTNTDIFNNASYPPDIRLVDDATGQGETSNQEWYLVDNSGNYSAQIRVC